MNYSKALLMILMMLSFALAGCTSSDEKETRYEIQGYMIIHDYDSPQKVGFNKQDALLNLEFESNMGASVEWANLTITVEVLNSDGKQYIIKGKGRHYPCVVPRAIPIVGAMAAMVILDYYLINKTKTI